MSAVNITNVAVLDNPASFLSPFQFEISYECVTPLQDDLEWKLIYVGSAEDETYDQVLESVLVGPVNVGNYRFVLQEFVRVGYYVNNDYDAEQLREEPPQKVLIDRVQRNILTDKPRVTKFPINFRPENSEREEQVPPPDHVGEEEDRNEGQLPFPKSKSDEDGA
ncbi:histone chaperone ASF1B-like isoform X2 [Solanum stenotomum]|uniref:histone chaperone ASF1B-like isoform X2 n=1 Tax=Solanum stenotomum TaxID=172797 RepID=UPI0020CFEF9B|nr:histone chaperone ASF1B-like isoform X2 [Solanum stenotomum]